MGRETLPILFGIKKSRNYGKTKLKLLKGADFGGFIIIIIIFSQNANAVVTANMHVSVYRDTYILPKQSSVS